MIVTKLLKHLHGHAGVSSVRGCGTLFPRVGYDRYIFWCVNFLGLILLLISAKHLYEDYFRINTVTFSQLEVTNSSENRGV